MSETVENRNFVKNIIDEDLKSGKVTSQVVTRFPPEPNGYLHIGHAKSICLNFGLAQDYQGVCHLRFDDTNPEAEDIEYAEAIKEDIKWLGFDWGVNLFHASDYFEKLYQFAVKLIELEKAYVDDSSLEMIREYRGNLTQPGKESPSRTRSIEENLDLFARMRAGEFDDGAMVLRAKIDMSSPNMNMRDPLLYRIRKVEHQRTASDWVIYPLYDFTHPLSDMLEGITHSVCTLEFEDHRPLYDWLLDTLKTSNHPRQIEFARLNLDYTVMSKRMLLELVELGHVNGWDDPRMLTVKGLRRRGYTAESIRNFCQRLGVSKKNTIIDMGVLEHAIREDLDQKANRAMVVLDPIKVTITNLPEDYSETFSAPKHPKNPDMGRREIPFSNQVYIDRNDFTEDPPKKYFRLKPGGEVRLRYAYVIRCEQVIKDADGKITELKCVYDPETKGGVTPEGKKKAKGIIHWVSCKSGIPAEVRVYDRLFSVPNPGGDKTKDFKEFLNPNSLMSMTSAFLEPSLATVNPGSHYQFERLGYFCSDNKDHTPEKPVFNRTVSLRDTWKA